MFEVDTIVVPKGFMKSVSEREFYFFVALAENKTERKNRCFYDPREMRKKLRTTKKGLKEIVSHLTELGYIGQTGMEWEGELPCLDLLWSDEDRLRAKEHQRMSDEKPKEKITYEIPRPLNGVSAPPAKYFEITNWGLRDKGPFDEGVLETVKFLTDSYGEKYKDKYYYLDGLFCPSITDYLAIGLRDHLLTSKLPLEELAEACLERGAKETKHDWDKAYSVNYTCVCDREAEHRQRMVGRRQSSPQAG